MWSSDCNKKVRPCWPGALVCRRFEESPIRGKVEKSKKREKQGRIHDSISHV